MAMKRTNRCGKESQAVLHRGQIDGSSPGLPWQTCTQVRNHNMLMLQPMQRGSRTAVQHVPATVTITRECGCSAPTARAVAVAAAALRLHGRGISWVSRALVTWAWAHSAASPPHTQPPACQLACPPACRRRSPSAASQPPAGQLPARRRRRSWHTRCRSRAQLPQTRVGSWAGTHTC